MIPLIKSSVFILLVLTLPVPRPVYSCEKQNKPLLLSPYVEKLEVDTARSLSKVNRNCLEDFVPDSYSGFLTVDKELGNHLFFWLFPCSENETAPLLLWLNGGPTVSSMLGLFWENGPLEVIDLNASKYHCGVDMKPTDSGYRKREYSWTKSFSMLYVDNPAGVGFSFSDSGRKGHRTTEEGYTGDMVSFMKQFFKLFPEYKARPVYFGGQSYAGKFISALAYNIHIEMQKGESNFNLTGIFLGAPFFDPPTQLDAYEDYLYNMGVISHHTMLRHKQVLKQYYGIAENAEKDGNVSQIQLHAIDFGSSLDNIVTKEIAGYLLVADLLKRPEIKSAIHVGNLEFRVSSGNYGSFENDLFLVSTKSKMAELMNDYKVLIYNGDFDIVVNTPSIEAALLTTLWNFQEEYNTTERSSWKLDEDVVGYYSLTDKFCRVVIRGSGHQVPHDKPETSYVMMQQFINDGCVWNTRHRLMTSASAGFHNMFLNCSILFQRSFTLFVLVSLLNYS